MGTSTSMLTLPAKDAFLIFPCILLNWIPQLNGILLGSLPASPLSSQPCCASDCHCLSCWWQNRLHLENLEVPTALLSLLTYLKTPDWQKPASHTGQTIFNIVHVIFLSIQNVQQMYIHDLLIPSLGLMADLQVLRRVIGRAVLCHICCLY